MKDQLNKRQEEILNIIDATDKCAISTIRTQLSVDISTPTLNRDLRILVGHRYLDKNGRGRNITYSVSPLYKLSRAIPPGYFDLDPDQRAPASHFNPDIFNVLDSVDLLSEHQVAHLSQLQYSYYTKLKDYPDTLYRKELERLTIELSWKSSEIEGNTYSLLDTERLFLENREAHGKPKEDSIMLLNHKTALNHILQHQDTVSTFDIPFLENLHTMLVRDLGVSRNIRSRLVRVTGTSYHPPDNQFQIREHLENTCTLINSKSNMFEKALLAVLLLSYIQPFEDGNKRTARMAGNALLIANGACPLTYRGIDSIDYKKAMLLFYEQNHAAAFRDIFITQNEYSVHNYFG